MGKNNNTSVALASDPTVETIKAVKVPTLTVGQARKVIDAETYFATMDAAKAQEKALGDLAGDVIWNRALLVHNGLYVSGFVKGKTLDNGTKVEAAPFKSQAAYAAQVGISPTYLSRLVALGRAAMIHGIRRGTKDWALIVTSDGMSGGVRDALMGDDTAKVREAIDAKREGKPLKRAAVVDGGDTVKDDKDKGDGEAPATGGAKVPATVGDVKAALVPITTALHGLSDADAEKIHAVLLGMVDSDRDRRKVLADAAAEKTAHVKSKRGQD